MTFYLTLLSDASRDLYPDHRRVPGSTAKAYGTFATCLGSRALWIGLPHTWVREGTTTHLRVLWSHRDADDGRYTRALSPLRPLPNLPADISSSIKCITCLLRRRTFRQSPQKCWPTRRSSPISRHNKTFDCITSFSSAKLSHTWPLGWRPGYGYGLCRWLLHTSGRRQRQRTPGRSLRTRVRWQSLRAGRTWHRKFPRRPISLLETSGHPWRSGVWPRTTQHGAPDPRGHWKQTIWDESQEYHYRSFSRVGAEASNHTQGQRRAKAK